MWELSLPNRLTQVVWYSLFLSCVQNMLTTQFSGKGSKKKTSSPWNSIRRHLSSVSTACDVVAKSGKRPLNATQCQIVLNIKSIHGNHRHRHQQQPHSTYRPRASSSRVLVGINIHFWFRETFPRGDILQMRIYALWRLTQKTGKRKKCTEKPIQVAYKNPPGRTAPPMTGPVVLKYVYIFFLLALLWWKVFIKDRNRCHIVWARVVNTKFSDAAVQMKQGEQ